MSLRDRLEWALEHPTEFMAALREHPEGPWEAAIYVEVFHREVFIEEMFYEGGRESRKRVARETVDAAMAAEAEPPDAWDARDKTKEASP